MTLVHRPKKELTECKVFGCHRTVKRTFHPQVPFDNVIVSSPKATLLQEASVCICTAALTFPLPLPLPSALQSSAVKAFALRRTRNVSVASIKLRLCVCSSHMTNTLTVIVTPSYLLYTK